MSGGGSSGAGAGGEVEVSSTVLSAPPGWTKKVTPLKGGTPKRKEVIFIAPTGEELSSKRQVEMYLKSHPGGPELSEFYWGSGETPRRSSRLSVKTKEVDTPESGPPKKRSRNALEKKRDDTETEAALEEEQGDVQKEQEDDVQMHDTEAAVVEEAAEVASEKEAEVAAEKEAEVKAIDAQVTPELNNIDDLRAPVAPSDGAEPVKESMHDDSVETKKDDTVAEVTTEEIPISEHIGGTEVAVKDDTKNGKTTEASQVKVDTKVQEDASNEQQQVKANCPEVVVGEKEAEHAEWTREIQVEDGSLSSSTLFDEKKEGDLGPIFEVAAAETQKVTGNSYINAEDGEAKPQPPQGEVKPQPPQQQYTIDLEQLPAP